jgi:hypothetical protein
MRHVHTKPEMTIDKLKSYGADPAYFGLGFIQLKMTPNERIHFYHNELPILAEEPHNHRYGFYSYILNGQFEQTLYHVPRATAYSGTHIMSQEDCSIAKSPSSADEMSAYHHVIVKEIFCGLYQAGDVYRIEADTFHTVTGINNAITYLVRDEPHKKFAQVVREIDAEHVCPFSQPIPSSQCWDMIEEMLSGMPENMQPAAIKNKPGYHLTDIKKGVLGEVSKIIEEAFEIQDAHEQGVKIMTQVEMSDLYGALDHYRERHHPELTMDDIRAMYMVTRRAFDNGRRI